MLSFTISPFLSETNDRNLTRFLRLTQKTELEIVPIILPASLLSSSAPIAGASAVIPHTVPVAAPAIQQPAAAVPVQKAALDARNWWTAPAAKDPSSQSRRPTADPR